MDFLELAASFEVDPRLIFWATERDGTFLYTSPAVERLLGYEPSQIIGKQALQFYHPEDETSVPTTEVGLVLGAEVDPLVRRIRSASGRYRWFESTVHVIADPRGNNDPIFVGVARDVTQRYRNAILSKSAERIAQLGWWERDINTPNGYWSEGTYRIAGLNPQDTMSVDGVLATIHPADVQRIRGKLENMKSGQRYDETYRMVRPDGSMRWVHSMAESVTGDGVTDSVVGTLQDITERVQADQALRLSRERLHLAHRIAKLGHWDWEHSAVEAHVSDSMYEMLGVSPRDFQFMPEHIEPLFHPEDRPRILACMREIADKKPSGELECRVIRPSGETIWIRCIWETILDESNSPCRTIGTIQEITEYKRTEEMLRRSERLTAVGELAAGIAHEIRNPVTVARGFLQLLMEHGLDERASQYVDTALEELLRTEAIISDYLNVARPQVTLDSSFGVLESVSNVASVLSSYSLLHNVTLLLEPVRDFSINGDRIKFEQTLMNLIKNGIESDAKAVTVTVNRSGNDGIIRIVDDGIGMSSTAVSQLGSPFYSTKSKGTGLGLMVTFRLIEAMGGFLEFKSAPGRGTSATIRFPTNDIGSVDSTRLHEAGGAVETSATR